MSAIPITAALRSEILSACDEPGAVIAEVARRYKITASRLYGWRNDRRHSEVKEAAASFVEVSTVSGPPVTNSGSICRASISLEHCEFSVSGKISAKALSQIVSILEAQC